MVWKLKSKVEPETSAEQESARLQDLEKQKAELELKVKQLKALETMPERTEEKPEEAAINKQELIDAIQGNMMRTSRMIEILRGA